ncbi:MAG: hypothetical protein AABZ10_05110 [Nitrospirota bacterium]
MNGKTVEPQDFDRVVREDDTKERLIRLVNGVAGVSKVEDNVAVVGLFVD